MDTPKLSAQEAVVRLFRDNPAQRALLTVAAQLERDYRTFPLPATQVEEMLLALSWELDALEGAVKAGTKRTKKDKAARVAAVAIRLLLWMDDPSS